MGRLSPSNTALTDRILTALIEGDATSATIATRCGSAPCWCSIMGRPGEREDGRRCETCGQTPGWRPAYRNDVHRLLVRLEKLGEVCRLERDPDMKSILWRRVTALVVVDHAGEVAG